jgi:AAA+ superfamily predicted ATPase
MLLKSLPLDSNIDIDKLSIIENICGRDIKNAVVKAAQITAINNCPAIGHSALEESINEIITSNQQVKQEEPINKKLLASKIKRTLRRNKGKTYGPNRKH